MDELPEVVRQVCARLTHALDTTAEGLLEGFHLRGSLAWGEFFPGSDIDFTAVLSRRPGPHDLTALEAAHTQIWFEFPEHDLDGHHVLLDDLRRSPSLCPPVPVVHHGRFSAQGRRGLDPVAWRELDERGIRVSGREPARLGIATSPVELWRFAQHDLATNWARTARELKVGWLVAGRNDDVLAWATLGAARAHHLLLTGEPTSRSGAGRYVLERLDERWQPLATEALRVREQPGTRGAYRGAPQRGKDLRDFVAWCVADAALQLPPVEEDF